MSLRSNGAPSEHKPDIRDHARFVLDDLLFSSSSIGDLIWRSPWSPAPAAGLAEEWLRAWPNQDSKYLPQEGKLGQLICRRQSLEFGVTISETIRPPAPLSV